MAIEKKGRKKKLIVELKVYMHCKGCESSVFMTLQKLKGVEEVKVDMDGHKAIVIGRIKPEKILKKLRKKTGKKAEILTLKEILKNKQKENYPKNEELNDVRNDKVVVFEDLSKNNYDVYFGMFSDDNPNSCLIM
ncbi:Heavy metal-associated isoprenylated plant protein 26 [Dendrobium catenatum]|uniref:Heavy metal-associated isoprenylated plant protein 26 n=1 Tax=Dendrobium catenatum TaxID=906689 RepID=A0A2I0XCH5_9ASPA|nr:Heavy metal-associated isoprenylated plant protein 26 [Dendrobium catenatum]